MAHASYPICECFVYRGEDSNPESDDDVIVEEVREGFSCRWLQCSYTWVYYPAQLNQASVEAPVGPAMGVSERIPKQVPKPNFTSECSPFG